MTDTRERIDTASRTWRAVQDWATDRLAAARRRLEQRGLEGGDTEFERGQIDALRSLLAVPEPTKEIPPTSPRYTD